VYRDRQDAARSLSRHLIGLNLEKPVILAIPRGGVVVGQEVALQTGGDLDIVMAKKIGAPFNPEFAVGAVDVDGRVTFPPGEVRYVSEQYIHGQAAQLRREIAVRLKALRQGKPAKPVSGRNVFLVDDGLATGLTALAAINYVRTLKPSRLILAVPVAPQDTLDLLSGHVDHTVCPLVPDSFYAVGQWYHEFGQTSDQEVKEILSSFKAQ
jgi:putative phosphoribosyl transferase